MGITGMAGCRLRNLNVAKRHDGCSQSENHLVKA
jgi:hypothetical protein